MLFASNGASCDIVTQNVDRLHFKAGSSSAVELHGNAFNVNCTSCDYTVDRQQLHRDIVNNNLLWLNHCHTLLSHVAAIIINVIQSQAIRVYNLTSLTFSNTRVRCNTFHHCSCHVWNFPRVFAIISRLQPHLTRPVIALHSCRTSVLAARLQ